MGFGQARLGPAWPWLPAGDQYPYQVMHEGIGTSSAGSVGDEDYARELFAEAKADPCVYVAEFRIDGRLVERYENLSAQCMGMTARDYLDRVAAGKDPPPKVKDIAKPRWPLYAAIGAGVAALAGVGLWIARR